MAVVQFCDSCGIAMNKDFQQAPQFILKMESGDPKPQTLCNDCWEKMSDFFVENEKDKSVLTYTEPEPEQEEDTTDE